MTINPSPALCTKPHDALGLGPQRVEVKQRFASTHFPGDINRSLVEQTLHQAAVFCGSRPCSHAGNATCIEQLPGERNFGMIDDMRGL